LRLEDIPLDKIYVSESNVRKTHPEEDIGELARSIAEIGLQQPIVVFPKGNRYELIIGQRRYLACKQLGWREIPALITQVKRPIDASIVSFSENIHRLELDYRDKMEIATELLSKLGSVDKVAERLGVSEPTVRNYLGYSIVPEGMKKMVDEGRLGATTAIRIARNIPDEEKAIRIAEKVREQPTSDRKRAIIEVARENPDKSSTQVAEIVNRQEFRKITVEFTTRVAEALEHACESYKSDPEDIVLEAVEEWLRRREFI